MYSLTTCYNWGPVVPQRLFAVAGVELLVRFHDTSNRLFRRSSHHVALLRSWPHLLIAAAFAGASRRMGRAGVPVLVLATSLICGKAVLATNVHLSQFIRTGAAGSWTDAVYGLSDYLRTQAGKQVVVLDWGIFMPDAPGLQQEVLKVIPDSNGRPVYEVFTIRRRYAE